MIGLFSFMIIFAINNCTDNDKTELALVTTDEAGTITATTAVSGGYVTSDGGADVTAKGVCWDTIINPTTADSKTNNGNGTGGYGSQITGLRPNKTYYVRAYAVNSVGTAYGNEINFTTLNGTAPPVTTTSITNITANSAVSGGTISSDGGAPVTARGVCWDTLSDPTILKSHTSDSSGTGSFVSNITGLLLNKTYYVRAYAVNSIGVRYGNELSLSITVPAVTTDTSEIVSYTTITTGGRVTNKGGADVTARGVCWSVSHNPALTDSHTINGTGTGTFTSSLINLMPNTTYYIRAYATNSIGTGYGNEISRKTLANTAPVVTTNSITDYSYTTATCGGNVTSDGGLNVTLRGVCWSTLQNPTTADSKTNNGTGTGAFTSSMTNLTPNTLYYVRAFSTNSLGTSYGNQVTVTTLAYTAPTVTTGSVSAYSYTTATCGGNVTADGGQTVTARGVCWSALQNPTIADSKTNDGNGTGTYISSLTSLAPNTIYYVRAYASNSIGTNYGNEISFTTLALSTPLVQTNQPTNIQNKSAICGGTINSDGGISISERGICWDTLSNPTYAANHISSGTGIGSFLITVTGLTKNTTYYLRAFARNSLGISYGDNISFNTLNYDATITDIDGNLYHTIVIGTQEWLIENLKTTKYRDGTPIPNVTVDTTWINLRTGAYRNYNDNPSYSTVYGLLYNWYAVTDTHILAPQGWHVASDSDWTILINYLGGSTVAGGKMKETGTSHWWNPNTGATNESGFTALPGGGTFGRLGDIGSWWTITSIDLMNAWRTILYHDYTGTTQTDAWKPTGLSVRCVKD